MFSTDSSLKLGDVFHARKIYREAVKKWSAQNNDAFPDEQTKEEIGAEVTRRLLMKYQTSGAENTGELNPTNLPNITSLD